MSAYQELLFQTRPIPIRPRMPRLSRAKIFAPYQALKGLEDTVHAKDIISVPRAQPAEYVQECLDRSLRRLRKGDVVTVTWFQPGPGAEDRNTGQYVTEAGMVQRIDPVFRVLFLNKRRIPMEDISQLHN